MVIKNSQLGNSAIEALNNLIEMDINAGTAFKLTRLVKELSSILEDKVTTEKKILNKWIEKDVEGNPIVPKDKDGNEIEGSVNITDMNSFNEEMKELMEVENTVDFEKIDFDDLGLKTAKVKDLMVLDFLFK